MNLRLWSLPGLICLFCLTATLARAECTLRDKQALLDSGKSLYEIDKICGEIKETGKNPEPELTRPKRPDTHGRLQESSNICQTEYLWCEVSQAGPPGTPCQCNTRYGLLFGVIIRK